MPARPAKSSRATTAQSKARVEYRKMPTRTPAEDPGSYSKTPHDYGDVLIKPDAKGRTKLGGALQRDLVYWIERHTWGKNIGTPSRVVRPEWANLSLAQLAKLCGSDRRTVARALADLCQRGIIAARDRTGCGSTVAKMYKLTPDRWKKAPLYEAKAMEIEASDETEEAEEELPEQATDEPERTVDPGRVSKPQAVAISPSRGAPAVAIRLVYRSVDLPFPVAFKAHPGRNGRVQISCRATAPQFFANSSPHKNPVTVESEHDKSYSEFLTPFVLQLWGKALDKSLLNQIVTAANGAPIAVYERVVLIKFKGSRKLHQTGLLIELAKDASAAWKLERLDEWQRLAREARQRVPVTADELAALEAELNTPERPRCAKCLGLGIERTNEGKKSRTCSKCQGTGDLVIR